MDDILKYYEILGLKPGATEEQIKQAYRDLAKVWHPDRFPNDPRLQEKAQEKLKEINLAYDYLKAHQYTPPPDDERHYSEKEEPFREEKPEPEESRTTYTTTYKANSFFSRIPKWVMIVIAIVLIRALFSYLNTPPKPQKTEYKPPLYYPLPPKPVSPVIEPPAVTEKPKLQKPITKPLTKPPSQTSKVSSQPSQDEALKETQDTPQTSEEDLKYAAVKEQIQKIERKLEERKEAPSQSLDKVILLPPPQPSISRNYFTIGSSKEEVLAVQGTPTSIVGETWYYSYSTVNFYSGRVRGYSDTSRNLRVKMAPQTGSESRRPGDYFTLGSTKDDVLAVQRTPTSIVGDTWYYSYSTINFYNERVKGYSNTSNNLHVKVLPKSESSLTSKGYFTIGSTHDEVLAVQGTPSSIIGETWYYSYSTISFYNGRVKGYSNTSQNLKVKLE
jgi:curved DNA-binding protein CbpA